MRSNLDSLATLLQEAVDQWNEFTEDDSGGFILNDTEVREQADMAYDTIVDNLTELGLI